MAVLCNPMALDGRIVMVTGASSGIGRATALLAARLGGRVILNGRDEARLQETLDLLPGDGHAVRPFDLTDLAGVPGHVKRIASEIGPLSVLLHCAGVQSLRPIRVFDQAFFDHVLHTNLASAFALAKGFRQKLCHANPAAIVFISSVAGLVGAAGNSVYAAAKGGLISATRSLAMELLRDDIRVNCVAPALVDTGIADAAKKSMTPETFEAMVRDHPMGMGAPEDVAHAMLFLASPAAAWITGVCLPVDGGCVA